MHTIILAGGVGTRLWPRSRESTPKQFSDITGFGRTMLQSTLDRLKGLATPAETYIVTGRRYIDLARSQADDVPPRHVIGEPLSRNTAPAIGLACFHLRRQGVRDVVAILPADHIIRNVPCFHSAMRQAERAAQDGSLVLLGIEPDMPHTGYGYIKRGDAHQSTGHDELPVYSVERFHEKPDFATAKRFVADGAHYWNGGIFVCRVDRLLEEFMWQMPDLYEKLLQIESVIDDPAQYDELLAELWPQMPNVSIDYGVVEGAGQTAVVPLQAGWSDVGSWDALEQILSGDETDNIKICGDVFPLDSTGNLIYGNGRFMALVGVRDLVVVDTTDALLIGHKSHMQSVKKVVEHLRDRKRNELL